MNNHQVNKNHSAQWDAIRGCSMLIMILIDLSNVVGWQPLFFNWIFFAFPVIEPIFFLSGFLICWRTTQYVLNHPQKLTSIMKLYVQRRMLRTWPLYFLIVITVFIVPSLAEGPLVKPFWRFATFTMNVDLWPPSGLSTYWSLCVEEWCYLAFLLLVPFLRFKSINYVFISLALLSLVVRANIVLSHGALGIMDYLSLIHFSTLAHWDAFWWGCVMGHFYPSLRTLSTRTRLYFLAAGFTSLVLYFVLVFAYGPTLLAIRQVINPFFGIIAAAGFVLGMEAIPASWLARTGIVQFGIMSYSFYLLHRIFMHGFIRFNRHYQLVNEGGWLELSLCLAFLLLAGSIFYAVFERPILKLLNNKFSFRRTLESKS